MIIAEGLYDLIGKDGKIVGLMVLWNGRYYVMPHGRSVWIRHFHKCEDYLLVTKGDRERLIQRFWKANVLGTDKERWNFEKLLHILSSPKTWVIREIEEMAEGFWQD